MKPLRHPRAEENASRLEQWLKDTPLGKVPRNQFGKAARQAICRTLGISRSTVATNPRIHEAFERLDKALERRYGAKRTQENTLRLHPLPDLSAYREASAWMGVQLDDTKAKLARLTYFEDTAVWLD